MTSDIEKLIGAISFCFIFSMTLMIATIWSLASTLKNEIKQINEKLQLSSKSEKEKTQSKDSEEEFK